MKNYITVVLALVTFTISAQEFSGKAIYKTSRKSNFQIKSNNPGMDDKMQEELKKRIQKMNQKTYVLNFDKNTSTYKQKVKLNAPNPATNRRVNVISFGGSSGNRIYYKNTKEKRYAYKTDIMGKAFLIKDELPKYDWKLTSETKNIGQYTCYKATYTKEVTSIKMSIVDGESKEVENKEMVTTTAWYTPQIPISNGPYNYQGLPGLILEINDGKQVMVCTEIVLNPSEKIKIEEPQKGKIVNQKKFNEIQKKKSKEMMDRFKSRNGVDLGNGIKIKVGG